MVMDIRRNDGTILDFIKVKHLFGPKRWNRNLLRQDIHHEKYKRNSVISHKLLTLVYLLKWEINYIGDRGQKVITLWQRK